MNSKKEEFENVPMMFPPIGEASEAEKEFINTIEKKYQVKIGDYWKFHKWSVENTIEFWSEILKISGIKYSKHFDQVIDLDVPMSETPEWFRGARLNYAENILKYKDDRIALITTGEDKETGQYTFAELYEKVQLYAAAFKNIGLAKGDVVACYMSNREEPIFAMLAVVSIGAIWTGALPFMGSQAVLNRFQQVKPKFLITVDKFSQNREVKEMLHKVKEIADCLTSLEKVIIVPSNDKSNIKDISMIRNSCFLEEFLQLGIQEDGSIPPLEFEQLSVSHPVFITYTSGTTGLPKAIVHGSGPLFHMAKESCFGGKNVRKNVFLSISPVGWATWLLAAKHLYVGMTVVLFEGVPYFLSPTFLWDLIDKFKIGILFLPPSVLDELESKDYIPTKNHNLKSLTVLVSGSSVVKPHNYDFVYSKIKQNMAFVAIYGSTELMGACTAFHRTLPIYRGEITCPNLGFGMQCINDSGIPVEGEVGEIVVSKPAPSLPLGLWGDEDGSLYKATYFSRFKDKFAMGDLGIINPVTKGIVVYCRSDETLKPGGCRFGSSEIYNVVNKFPKIQDSLCVSQYSQERNERAVLFVKMKEGFCLNESLVKRIRLAIEKELSSDHVPGLILETPEIPHNMNGKKLETTVKNIINGIPYNSETVMNQACLEFYRHVPTYEN